MNVAPESIELSPEAALPTVLGGGVPIRHVCQQVVYVQKNAWKEKNKTSIGATEIETIHYLEWFLIFQIISMLNYFAFGQ